MTYADIMRAIREALADCDRYDEQQRAVRRGRREDEREKRDETGAPTPTR